MRAGCDVVKIRQGADGGKLLSCKVIIKRLQSPVLVHQMFASPVHEFRVNDAREELMDGGQEVINFRWQRVEEGPVDEGEVLENVVANYDGSVFLQVGLTLAKVEVPVEFIPGLGAHGYLFAVVDPFLVYPIGKGPAGQCLENDLKACEIRTSLNKKS